MDLGSGEAQTGACNEGCIGDAPAYPPLAACAVWTTTGATAYREIAKRGRAHEPWCCGEVEAGFLLSQKRKVGVCSHHAQNVARRQTTWQRAWSLNYGAASRIRRPSCIAVSSHFAACKAAPNCGALAGTGAVGHMSSRRRYPRCRIVAQGPRSTRPGRAGLPRGAVVLCGCQCLVPSEWYGAMCCAIQFQQASCYSAGCPAVTADWVEQRPHHF